MPSTRLINLGLLLGSAALLWFGYYLEWVRGLEPCPLCLIQRLFFALIGITALIAVLHHPGRVGTIIYASLNELFALGGGLTRAGRCGYSNYRRTRCRDADLGPRICWRPIRSEMSWPRSSMGAVSARRSA